VKSTTFRLVATLTTKRSDIFSAETKIDSVFVTYRGDQLYVDIHSFAPTVTTAEFQKRAELFQQYLSAELKEPVHLQLQVIPVEMLRFKVGPSTAESVATETRNKDGEGDPEPTAVETPD
jgi:hypothetical protein